MSSRAAHVDRWFELALLILVLALAAFLRLYRLDLIDVRFDEASALQLALGIARGNLLAVAPFSGSVANHPPAYLYALALPYLFTRDFMAVAAYRVLLDVVAIALCWWLCRRFFSVRVALMASLLFAVAPWAIQFARKTWLAPLPLAGTVLLFGLLEAVQRKNPWGWAIAGWGLAFSIGAHLTAVYLVPVVIVALILGRHTLRLAPVAIGIAPLVVLAALYLGHDAGNGFANVRALAGAGGAPAAVSLDALRFALWSSGGAHLSDLTGGAFPQWRAQVPEVLGIIDTLQMALVAGGAALLIVLALRRRSPFAPATIAIVVLWLVVPVLLQLRHSRPLQIHYFVPLYPAPFIVAALGIDAAIGLMRTPRMAMVMRWAAAGALALIVGWHVFATLRFAQFVQMHDTGLGGYGAPVRSALDAAGRARDAVRAGQARDVIVVAPGGDPAVDGPATVMDVLLADVPHRFADAGAGVILRDDGAQYLFTPGTERAQQALLANIDASSAVTASIPLRAGSADAYTYVRAPQLRLAPLRERSAQWANGVGMLGYRLGQGDALPLQVLLRVFREAPPERNYHWFNHAYAGDRRVAQTDGGGVHPRNWRAGDILLHWFDIPVPADASPDRIRIGSYLYPEVQPVMVIDGSGNPIDDGVDVPR